MSHCRAACQLVFSSHATSTVIVSEDSFALAEGGAVATYTIVLGDEPVGTVVVSLTPQDALIGVAPTSVSFTSGDYATPQTITVTAPDDGVITVASGFFERTITHTVSAVSDSGFDAVTPVGGGIVTATVYDDDATAACTLTCPAGRYAGALNANTVVDVCQTCPLGHYCLEGDCTVTPVACAAGTFSAAPGADSPASCTSCTTGRYNEVTGASICKNCPAGSVCNPSDALPSLCAAGRYTAAADNTNTCRNCVAGRYGPFTGMSACLDCPEGFRCPGTSQTSPTVCASGQHAVAGQSACTDCPAGETCPRPFQPGFEDCPSGMFQLGNNGFCVPCPAGYSCAGAAGAPVACTAGRYSPDGQSVCEDCAAGTYTSLAGSPRCFQCPAGFSCTDRAVEPVACAAGTSSAVGEDGCTACVAGTYADTTAAPACQQCPAGFSCSAATTPAPCATGEVSPAGVMACQACPGTTYTPPGSNDCLQCPPGHECAVGADPVACAAGRYAAGSVCVDCPAGSYCPSPAVSPVRCPAGTYNPLALGNPTECTLCPAGSSCADPTSAAVACATGQYSPEGVLRCLDCPTGHYCPTTASLPVECPVGSYSDATRPVASRVACAVCGTNEQCTNPNFAPQSCPAGYYITAQMAECAVCPLGHECLAASPTTATPCAAGRYQDAIGRSTACIECPAGFACPTTTDPPVACLGGTYSLIGQINCLECPAGSSCTESTAPVACPAGSFSVQGLMECVACPPGHICPFPGIAEYTPCPLGTYVNADSTQCIDCAAGRYCPDPRVSTGRECEAGFYSLGSATSCTACPAGWACPTLDRNTDWTECAAGFYSPLGGAACIECPAGQFCPDKGAARPAGYCLAVNNQYSIAGQLDCERCPYGSECEVNGAGTAVVITACTAGQYRTDSVVVIDGAGASAHATCQDCPPGFACPEVDEDPQVCPPGRFQNQPAQVVCEDCPAGDYCPEQGMVGSIQCPAGTYSPSINQQRCRFCDQGSFCDAGSTTANNNGVCNVPRGWWFNPYQLMLPPSQSQVMYPCPPGYYGNANTCSGNFDTACTICPAGEFCEGFSLDNGDGHRGDCPVGHYCPQGTKSRTEHPCEAGTYNGATRQDDQSDCVECPAGSYCMEGADAPVQCEEGYYCPAATARDTQYPCTGGTYSDTKGLTIASACTTCPTGHFCPEGSNSPIPCRSGTYNSLTNQMFADACLPCEAGQVCFGSGLTYPDRDCCTGFYCPSGTAICTEQQCPAGTFMPFTNATNEDDCMQCPAGFACPRRTGIPSEQPIQCAKGHFCPAGTERPKQFVCPKGRYTSQTNLTDASECTVCDPGFYCEGGEDTVTDNCHAGHFCPAGTPAAVEFPCPAGRYTTLLNATASTDCFECIVGHYCLSGSVHPIPCEAGSYADTVGTQGPLDSGSGLPTECATCPGGSQCPAGTSDPVDCGVGFFSRAGLPECIPCLFGHYCDEATVSESNMLTNKFCAAGEFCPTGMDHVPVLPADGCPVGFQCLEGGGEDGVGSREPYPQPCPAGTFANTTGHGLCDSCPAGFYCLEGSIEPSGPCGWGYYCPLGSTSPDAVHCPEGTFRDTTGAARVGDCFTCTPGGYCPEASSEPVLCPPGQYCPSGAAVPVPCPKGRFGNNTGLSSESECRLCLPGFYCDETGMQGPRGLCDPGFFCEQGSATAQPGLVEPVDWNKGALTLGVGGYGGICPAGSYCPAGTWTPQPCPQGTYLQSEGQASADDCQQCDAGTFCAGSTLPSPTGNCTAGFFCTGGAQNGQQFEAPAGTFTSEGASAPVVCPVGRYNPLRKQAECAPCPAGFFCPAEGLTEGVVCPSGSYCPAGNQSDLLCPAGRYTAEQGAKSLSECLLCDEGAYCGSNGLSAPTGLCDAGYYCPPGQILRNPPGLECPPGLYCSTGSVVGSPCPAGRYQPSILAGSPTDCLVCPARFACPTGSVTPLPCEAGHFCSGGTETPTPDNEFPAQGGICPAGSFCNSTVSAPVACPAGRYSNTTGRAECDVCPVGTFCAGVGTTIPPPCSAGGYCPTTELQAPTLCPLGTYQPLGGAVDITDCVSCDSGKYCGAQGLAAPTANCTAGYYCIGGAVVPTGGNGVLAATDLPCGNGTYCESGSAFPALCPAGTYRNETRGTSLASCKLCDEGNFCEAAGLDAVTGPCAAGHYCKLGNVKARPSEGITFVAGVGDVGGDICPPGSFCITGSVVPALCPAGQFATQPGREMGCDACPAGFTCAQGATDFTDTVFSAPCPAGHYCPVGTADGAAIPCPETTFRNSTGGHDVGDCSVCPPGEFCQGEGNILPDGVCAGGYFCTGGSNSSTATNGAGGACQQGEFCPAGISQPIPCPGGQVCAGALRSSATPDGPCDAGYFCSGGSWTATPAGEVQRFDVGVIGDVCPAGHFCPSGSTAPERCPNGTANAATGSTSSAACAPCPSGFECATTAATGFSVPCPAGFYCLAGTSEALLQCWRGHKCPEGSSLPSACPSGTYQNLTGRASCDVCPPGFACGPAAVEPSPCVAGYVCPSGSTSTTQVACPAGTFSNIPEASELSQCSTCPAGQFCASTGLTAPSGTCDPGHYCLAGAISASPVASDCPAGYTCSATQGYNNASDTCTGSICPPGFYCPAGLTGPKPCPPGTALPSSGASAPSACLPCSAGFFCNKAAEVSTTANVCTAGRFCPGGDIEPTNVCPAGSFCPAGASGPTACPPGRYCPATGGNTTLQCPMRFFCSGSTVSPTICPQGFFCGAGQSVGTVNRCPVGTFGASTGLATASDCIECPAGEYCGSTALTSPTTQCSAGFFCSGGATTSMPTDGVTGDVCPGAHYCPTGSKAPIACPPGTASFVNSTGFQVVADCTPCDAGFYCPESAQTNSTLQCPEGFFCLAGTSIPSQPCPVGHICGVQTISPQPCPVGTYQDEQGSTVCKSCIAGHFCPSSGLSVPVKCPRGYYCEAGQSSGTVLPCPVSTFSNVEGLVAASECQLCEPGSFCDLLAQTSSSLDCAPGHFCIRGANVSSPVDGVSGGRCLAGSLCGAGSKSPRMTTVSTTGQPCPAGSICPTDGLTSATACPAGKFSRGLGELDCDDCIAGFYCPSGTINPVTCPLGNFCPGNATLPADCPDGTYGNSLGLQSADQCTPCPTGSFCLGGVVTGQCNAGFFCREGASRADPPGRECPAGYFCVAGTVTPQPCAANTFRFSSGGTSQASCTTCPAGFRCESNNPVPTPCDPGFFCPASTVIQPCPIGTFNELPQASAASNCTICPAGVTCNSTGISTLDHLDCPAGHYCLAGTTNNPTPCPITTFRVLRGGRQLSDCTSCPAGSVCPSLAALSPEPCPEGFFCPAGVSIPTQCPVATYCPVNSIIPTTCPAGHYCPFNASAAPIVCPPSRFCPQGTVVPGECNVGYFSIPDIATTTRDSQSSLCALCPPGTYSSVPGSAGCLPCDAGHVCLGGTPISNPTDPDQHNGYVCREGRFCPEGSSEEVPCAPGFINPLQRQTNSSACTACPAGTFQPEAAATECLSCGFTSDSNAASTTCTCQGENRRFLAAEGICVCDTFFSFEDSDGRDASSVDSNGACEPIIYDICDSDEARESVSGKCRPLDDAAVCAEGQCTGGTGLGTYDATTGLCECDELPDVLEVCGAVCQSESPRVSIDAATGLLRIDTLNTETSSPSFGDFETTLVPLDSISGSLLGDVACLPGLRDGQAAASASQSVALTSATLQNARENAATAAKCSVQTIVSGTDGFFGQYGVPSPVLDTIASGFTIPLTFASANSSVRRLERAVLSSGSHMQTPLTLMSDSELIGLAKLGIRRGISLGGAARGLVGPHTAVHPSLRRANIVVSPSFLEESEMLWEDVSGPAAHLLSASQWSLFDTPLARHLQSSASSAAIQSQAPSIQQPLVCISLGDTIMWDLRQGAGYPVYVRDSLLNSADAFDFGRFEELGRLQSQFNNITLFAFTFRVSGIFTFTMSNLPQQQMLVRVAEAGSTCPTDGPIVPLNLANLIEVGARRNDDLVLEVDWVFVAWTITMFVITTALIVFGFCYCHKTPWGVGRVNRATVYRKKGQRVNLLQFHQKGQNTESSIVADTGSKPEPDDTTGGPQSALASFGKDVQPIKPLGPAALATVLEGDSEEDEEEAETQLAIANLLEGRGAGDSSSGAKGQDLVNEILLGAEDADGGNRWDADDLELGEILERVMEHAEQSRGNFGQQGEAMEGLIGDLREEAESIKRILRRAAYEDRVLKMAGGGDGEAGEAAVIDAGEEVLTELTKRGAADKSLAQRESDIIKNLFELVDALQGGSDGIAQRATEELRSGRAQLLMQVSPDDDSGAVYRFEGHGGPQGPALVPVEDVQPDSTLGVIGERVLALQASMDACASLLGAERERRGDALPVWKAVEDMELSDSSTAAGQAHPNGVSGLVRDAKHNEEAVVGAVSRLLEALEPFAGAAPSIHEELGSTVMDTGSILAHTLRVPAHVDAAPAAGSRKGGTKATGDAIMPAGRHSSDSEASDTQLLAPSNGAAAGFGALHIDTEASAAHGSSASDWSDKADYVAAVNQAAADAHQRIAVAIEDLIKVLGIIQSQVPNLKASAEEHRSALGAVRDAVYNEVSEKLDLLKDKADERQVESKTGASVSASELSALMKRLGALVKEKGGVPVDPLTAGIATRGAMEDESKEGAAPNQPDADAAEADADGTSVAGSQASGLEAKDGEASFQLVRHDSATEQRQRANSTASSAAGGTHGAAMLAVEAALELQAEHDAEKAEQEVSRAVAAMDEAEGGAGARNQQIQDSAAADAAELSAAIGLDEGTAQLLAEQAAADAAEMSAAVDEEADRAREDIKLELRNQAMIRAEQKAKTAEAGVVVEMEANVARKAAELARSHVEERSAAEEQYQQELQDAEDEAEAVAAAEEAKYEREAAELQAAIESARKAAAQGDATGLQAAQAASEAAAKLEATREREAALKAAHQQVQELQRQAAEEMEALRTDHERSLAAIKAKQEETEATEKAALAQVLAEERQRAESTLEAKHEQQLKEATTATERAALQRAHVEARENLQKELADEEEERKNSLGEKLRRANDSISSDREALMAAHEQNIEKVTAKLAERRATQSAGLRAQLEERKQRRARKVAERQAAERADAERAAVAAAEAGDEDAAYAMLNSLQNAHDVEARGLEEEAELAAEAADAADDANTGVMQAILSSEKKIAAATAAAAAKVEELKQELAQQRERSGQDLEAKLADKRQRKQAMVESRLEAALAAAGDDEAAEAVARQAAADELAAFDQQLQSERAREEEICTAKLHAAEEEAAAKQSLVESALEDEIAAIKLQWEADVAAAVQGVQSSSEQKAAATKARLRDKRIRRLRNVMIKAERQRMAIDEERSAQAAALQERMGEQSNSAHTWQDELLQKVAKHGDEGGETDTARRERSRLEAEAAAAAEALRAQQEAEAAEAAAAAEEEAARAREEAKRAALQEQQRLIAAKRAEQDAKRAAMGDVTQEELQRIKAEQEAEMAEYTAAMASNREEQDRKLNARLEARRARKARALARKQEEQRKSNDAKNARAMGAIDSMTASEREKKALLDVLSDGSLTPDRKAEAIEAVLGQRHSRETAELMAQQYQERQNRKKALLEGLYEEKRGEMAELMDDLKRQGADDAAVAEAEDKFNQRWSTQIATAEASLAAEVEGKHNSEQISLRQRQLAEVSEAFSALAPEDILRRHEMEEAAKEAQELAAFQAEMESEKQRRMAALKAAQAEAEAQWRSEQEAEMRKLEEEHQRMLRQQEAAAERQRLMREERARKEDEAARAAAESEASGVSEEERERIMAAFRADAKQRAQALMGEREKQEAAMKARLAARRRKKQAVLAKRMAEERNKIGTDAAAKSAEVNSSVAANMQRTMSALAQRAVRRSMASMTNMKRPKPAAAAGDAKPGSTTDSANKVPSRLAASAAAFQQGGADLSALASRVQQIEDAIKAVLAKSASAQGTAVAQGAAVIPSARSEVDDSAAKQGMLALAASSIDRPVAGTGPRPQDGRLVAVQDDGLPHRRRVRLRFARAIATAVGMMGPKAASPVQLQAATAFPKPVAEESCFRDVVLLEKKAGVSVLYVRVELLDQTAELFSVLNHALAVLKETGAFNDRTAPAVLATLNKNFMICGQELYRSVAATSATEAAPMATPSIRSGGAESLRRQPMRRLGSAIVPSMASRAGSGRDMSSLGSQFGGFSSIAAKGAAAPSLTKRYSFHG